MERNCFCKTKREKKGRRMKRDGEIKEQNREKREVVEIKYGL